THLRYTLFPSLFMSHFFVPSSVSHRDLHSFPTRRSSDLDCGTASATCRWHISAAAGLGLCVLRLRTAVSLPEAHTGQDPRLRKRSEEHTSELQSHLNLVCRLLLEKKKKIKKYKKQQNINK